MKLNELEILEKIKAKFVDVAFEWQDQRNGSHYVYVPQNQLHAVVTFLKETPELAFDFLMNLSAFDASKLSEGLTHIEVTYHFYSYKHRHSFVVKVKLPRGGSVQSLAGLYGAANFQEREVFDHFGVKFEGHPALTRILLPEDWVGHPLLKDYQEEEEYNGIGTTRPSLL